MTIYLLVHSVAALNAAGAVETLTLAERLALRRLEATRVRAVTATVFFPAVIDRHAGVVLRGRKRTRAGTGAGARARADIAQLLNQASHH